MKVTVSIVQWSTSLPTWAKKGPYGYMTAYSPSSASRLLKFPCFYRLRPRYKWFNDFPSPRSLHLKNAQVTLLPSKTWMSRPKDAQSVFSRSLCLHHSFVVCNNTIMFLGTVLCRSEWILLEMMIVSNGTLFDQIGRKERNAVLQWSHWPWSHLTLFFFLVTDYPMR